MARINLVAAFLLCAAAASAQDFDLLLTGGRVVDGSGNPWYRADIGVRNGRIAEIGNQVISPGFIDMMGNTSLPFLTDRNAAQSKLRNAPQGELIQAI